MLTVAAVISLAVGIYEDLTTIEYDVNGNRIPGVKWVEGTAIILAVLIVVVVGSVNDYQKEQQFRKLNVKKEDRHVSVSCALHDNSCIFGNTLLNLGDSVR